MTKNVGMAPLEGITPPDMAERTETAGVKKVHLDLWGMFVLAVLAGSFIGIGAEFCTLVLTNNGLGFGVSKLLGGLVFSTGLILVVIGGAELFTGNNLIMMAWLSHKVTLAHLMKNWLVVYAGNLVGSLVTVVLMYFTNQWAFADYQVGTTALNIANAKVNLTFAEGMTRGILCNALVCMAIWLCMSGKNTTDKILAVIFPITAFMALDFEHSIANMYFIPMGLLLKEEPQVVAAAGKVAGDLINLNLLGFLKNLAAVTIGNIFGGAYMVAAAYWFVYRRPQEILKRPLTKQLWELFHSLGMGGEPATIKELREGPGEQEVTASDTHDIEQRIANLLVRDYMTRYPITIDPDIPVTDALNFLRKRQVHRLPVLDRKGHLVGIISEKDLLYAFPSPEANLSGNEINYILPKLKVKNVMARDIITIEGNCSLREAVQIMVDHEMDILPVVHKGKLVGIITEMDMFKVFLSMAETRRLEERVDLAVSNKMSTSEVVQ